LAEVWCAAGSRRTRAALGVLPTTLPRATDVVVDGRVLLFAGANITARGNCFGLVPALKTRKPDVHETLKEGGREGSGTRHRAQGALVAAEMALALVLLIGAGLMGPHAGGPVECESGLRGEQGYDVRVLSSAVDDKCSRRPFGRHCAKFTTISVRAGVQGVAFSWGAALYREMMNGSSGLMASLNLQARTT